MSQYGPGACHGAHPEHGASFLPISSLHESEVCSICHAGAFGAEAAWYSCRAPHCDFVLCHKCFEVEETLLPVPQIVMRNPTLPYTDPPRRPIAVHTRPKTNSFQLAPIYPGKLLEIVSRAISKEDGVAYFRLQNGGWICSSNVVVITPTSETSNIAQLTEGHVTGAREAAARAVDGAEVAVPARTTESQLLACMRESMQLIDDNLPYGMVMSALVLYPLLSSTSRAASLATSTNGPARRHVENEEDSNLTVPQSAQPAQASPGRHTNTELAQTVLEFTHLVLYAALDDMERRVDEDEALDQGTVLSLYGDVIGGCLLALQDLSEVGNVVLPEAFVTLVLRALTFYANVTTTLQRRIKPPEYDECRSQRLRSHNVQRDNTDQNREVNRVYYLAQEMISLCSQLVQRSLHRYPLWLRQLVPLRHQLIYVKDEAIEATFCSLVTHSLTSPASAPTSQKQFFQVDPLEIVVRLLKTATLAASQLSALQMVSAAARKEPRNIAAIASIALPSILETLANPHSSSVVVAVLDCLCELAFNDPRRESRESFETPKRAVARRGGEEDQAFDMTSSSHSVCACSQSLHPGSAPCQPMHVFRIGGGAKVGLCSECAAQHPPASTEEVCEPEFAHFQCQCPLCARRAAQNPLPPPSVPATSAIKRMQDEGLWTRVSQRARLDVDNPAVLNSVGRLALRLGGPVELIQLLATALLQKSSLSACGDAVIAVAANRHLLPVQELLSNYPSSHLSRFIASPYTAVLEMGQYGGGGSASLRKPFGGDYVTPSQSHMKSELGLSPSPSIPGSAGFSSSAITDRHGSSSLHMAHPSVDLFPTSVTTGFAGL